MPPARTPRDVDVLVGARIASRRMELGLSQSDLAHALGITFQQVQKYERGTNRVSSSKLWMTAEFLGLPINALFPDAEEVSGEAPEPVAMTGTARRIGLEAKRLSPADQRMVAFLLRRLVGDAEPD